MEFSISAGKAPKWQGAIGEARCIYELTKLGYTIYKPLAELSKSDLVVEDQNGRLLKVQVKTSIQKTNSGGFAVNLVTTGGNTKVNTRKCRANGDYDFLFALLGDGRCFFIPESALGSSGTATIVGGEKYSEFELS